MPTRRDALRLLAAAPLAAGAARGQTADTIGERQGHWPVIGPFPGLITRMREPENLEWPFTQLDGNPNGPGTHYVRSHFAVPKLDAAAYRLTVEGAVGRPLSLTLAELAKLGEKSMPLTIECAGNGRVFLTPAVRGLQWGHGAVGTAEWGGTPLAAVLARAGVKKSAVEVLLVGADKGVVAEPASPGPIHFDRSLPLKKAMQPEVLLATRMGGRPLPASHGAPVRAVVGGWYGMASVKWLTKIVVVEQPHAGFWQTHDYSIFTRPNGVPTLTPVTAMQVKAVIAHPFPGQVVAVNRPLDAFYGAAWGAERIAKVDVSTDGGTTWKPADLFGEDKPFCWRLWRFDWTPAVRGPAKLVVRATDAAGNTQPLTRDPDRRTYMVNHLIPVDVVVE